ncbi:MAG: RNA 3'-terminal phosphate cyclase [Candidatus Micrarchaeia archaeon]
MIEIDGSHGEGGGQIIRTSMTLSAITKKPVRISNIRANRPNPGLQMQHLTAVKAVRNICRGTLEGAELGSTSLTFVPGDIIGGNYDFNILTAGSTSLVAQTIIPIALCAEKPSVFRIIGGTHVMKSPSYDYLEKIFVPAIRLFGANVTCELLKSGYYPRGGGEIEIKVHPSKLAAPKSFESEKDVSVFIRLSNLPLSIGIREKKIFVQNDIETVKIREEQAVDPGNALIAWAGLRGAYSLGEKSKRAEVVAQEAYDEIIAALDYDIDKHLADQLLVYAALSEGKTSFTCPEITDHLKTNAEILSKFVERKIRLDEKNKTVIID